ncbi:MAG TPA: phosphotransferase [Caulobacteraceae bacterium]
MTALAVLADIVRAFGLEAGDIRRAGGRHNVHWRVRVGDRRYALRRCGVWSETPGDIAWEIGAVHALAAVGVPVPAPVVGPREVGGATWLLMPWLEGRALRFPQTSETDYERLGAHLAGFHAASADLPALAQRPHWTANVDGALPREGGAERRAQLLAALGEADADMAARLADAAAELDARDLPAVFARYPRRLVHGDFSPWNIRVRRGALVGVFDFDLAHVDVRAADVAYGRRGSHDAVVRGYLKRAPLSDAEFANLDALWLGGVLQGVWRVLEDRLGRGERGADLAFGLDWNLAQLTKTRPYRP